MKVTAKDLREAIESYWDKLITIEAGGKRADREFCKGQALTSFDTLVQDAENWNTINPSGDAQVLIPKAAFDAMAEKAELFDIADNLKVEGNGSNYVTFDKRGVTIQRLKIGVSPVAVTKTTLAEALKAVPE